MAKSKPRRLGGAITGGIRKQHLDSNRIDNSQHVNQTARSLGLEIARCQVIQAVLKGLPSPCSEVVRFQSRELPDRWLAEPWSGHLERAPILFLGSNPSSGDPEAPLDSSDLTMSSDDDTVLHSFDDAFETGPWIGIHEGSHLRAPDGKVGSYVAYWGSCKARASELLGRPAAPGSDYALTEVVHCGSQHEVGVLTAAAECVPRYLNRILSLSPAVVIVVVGAVARDIVRIRVPALAGASHHVGPVPWAGLKRHALFLPHPNARRVPKAIAPYLGENSGVILDSLRTAIASASC